MSPPIDPADRDLALASIPDAAAAMERAALALQAAAAAFRATTARALGSRSAAEQRAHARAMLNSRTASALGAVAYVLEIEDQRHAAVVLVS